MGEFVSASRALLKSSSLENCSRESTAHYTCELFSSKEYEPREKKDEYTQDDEREYLSDELRKRVWVRVRNGR